jgi:hypothetical protein
MRKIEIVFKSTVALVVIAGALTIILDVFKNGSNML